MEIKETPAVYRFEVPACAGTTEAMVALVLADVEVPACAGTTGDFLMGM